MHGIHARLARALRLKPRKKSINARPYALDFNLHAARRISDEPGKQGLHRVPINGRTESHALHSSRHHEAHPLHRGPYGGSLPRLGRFHALTLNTQFSNSLTPAPDMADTSKTGTEPFTWRT